jgi:glutamate/tyrosine decarboxylase-like PLP-dependent enzyme
MGVRGLGGRFPVIYVSREAHHSFVRAARLTGLGDDAVHEIPVDSDLKISVSALARAIEGDRRAGKYPLFLVATLGTTSAGVFDPVAPLVEVARKHSLWLHLDAAWGGPAAILPECASLFAGCDRADSITIDAHKWLSVPLTAGLFFYTRHAGLLERAFRTEGTQYLPRASQSGQSDFHPYTHSMSWSRRFLGLKLFLSLAVAGWEGYREALRHQMRLGERLRKLLVEAGWQILNQTPFPIVCFTRPGLKTKLEAAAFAKQIADTGKAWITSTEIGNHSLPALRAGIANFGTDEKHVDALVALLTQQWERRAP